MLNITLVRWFLDVRFVASIVAIEGFALGILELTDALPDGNAKAYIIIVAGVVTGLIAQLRAWSKRTVDALG